MSKQKPKQKQEEDEYTGPNIYKELLVKPVTELKVDLTAPVEVLLNECTEFEILVATIQSTNHALIVDNKRLQKYCANIKKQEVEQTNNHQTQNARFIRERNELKETRVVLSKELVDSHVNRDELNQQIGNNYLTVQRYKSSNQMTSTLRSWSQ